MKWRVGRINLGSSVTKTAAVLLGLFCVSEAVADYTVTDSLGTAVTLASTPWRVVTMTPALAELASAIGLQETNIVAVSEYTDFPVSLKLKPSIGPYTKPNVEKIVSVKPDLVLASEDGTPHDIVTRLRKLKIPVMVIRTDSLAAVEAAYPVLWKAFGQEFQGKIALETLQKKTEVLRARAAERAKKEPNKRIQLLVQVGESPLVVAGGKNFLSEGLTLLGIDNAYRDARTAYPRVSVEDVLHRNPDAILLLALGDDVTIFEKAKTRWEKFKQLSAVKSNRIFILRSDALVRPGPRLPEGLEALEATLFTSAKGGGGA